MPGDPKNIAIEFLRRHPDATESDAVSFAREQFPNSPLTSAMFLRDWLSLHDRLVAAQQDVTD
jgi:hypothetical protein